MICFAEAMEDHAVDGAICDFYDSTFNTNRRNYKLGVFVYIIRDGRTCIKAITLLLFEGDHAPLRGPAELCAGALLVQAGLRLAPADSDHGRRLRVAPRHHQVARRLFCRVVPYPVRVAHRTARRQARQANLRLGGGGQAGWLKQRRTLEQVHQEDLADGQALGHPEHLQPCCEIRGAARSD
ncbi:hypothetical protein T492DRAFT_552742 [Pavlovales sp. CCMP2436]|nr:hypothetical protein T492DRAFT_552742 [Pavlovales sp. CCMP2436]